MVRRDFLKASLLAAGLPAGAAAAAAGVTPADVQRVATRLYAASLSAEDAEHLAQSVAATLANLHYLALLKSDDVQTPFGYPALIAEARRGLRP